MIIFLVKLLNNKEILKQLKKGQDPRLKITKLQFPQQKLNYNIAKGLSHLLHRMKDVQNMKLKSLENLIKIL